MFDFYERSSSWGAVFGSAMELPTLKAREQAFWEDIGRFQAAAFGPLAGDRIMSAAVAGFVHPATLGTKRSAGASLEEVVTVVGDALVDLAEQREAAIGRG
jgi:hypothetical protein